MSGPTATRNKPGGPGATVTKPSVVSPKVKRGKQKTAQRIVVYGPGGVGKTTLCSLLAKVNIKPLIIDCDRGSAALDVDRVEPETFEEVRAVLHDSQLVDNYQAIVTDSFTALEDLDVAWTLENVKHEKGHAVTSIEGYGYGKGFTHVYETFLKILADLDALARGGKHVIGVCHDCTASVPNPGGEDWIRYEPRLQQPPKTGQLRSRVKEWCDHLLYIGFDVAVSKDGKGEGSGSRSIHPVELPTHWAKSRSLRNVVPYKEGDAEIWKQLFGKE